MRFASVKSKLGGKKNVEAKLSQLPPTVKDPTTTNGLIPTCLVEVSICIRRCEFPQYIREALNRSHYTPFPRYPLISPEKGSSDLQTWDPMPGSQGWREVGPTSCRRSAGSRSRSVVLPSPFIFIRGVGCLCPASASDVDCRLGGIAISFQLVPKKFKITCHSSDCFTLLSTKHFDGERWIVSPANV